MRLGGVTDDGRQVFGEVVRVEPAAGNTERFICGGRVGLQWVAGDRDARGLHTGFEAEATLSRLVNQVKGAGVLPFAARVAGWARF